MLDTLKSISDKQLAANRANALKSTGPRTPEGIARSAQNALKHGFAAAHFVAPGVEDPEQFQNLLEDLTNFYQPINCQEQLAVQRIALAQQQIFRAYRLEAGVLGDWSAPDPHGTVAFAKKFPRRRDNTIDFALILRYQAQADRLYRRAVDEFERLKAQRDQLPPVSPNEPILEADPEETKEVPGREAAPDQSRDRVQVLGKGAVSPVPNPRPPVPVPNTGTTNAPSR